MFSKIVLFVPAIFFLLLLYSCDKDIDSKKKIGMFVVGEGYDDSGYTQNCKKGLVEAFKVYPYFDGDIPDSVKNETEVIKKGIIDGTIYTGI
ncbi:MAG: hypothetical protein KA807_15665 [Prolixibacteraceae bacterium]|nr:hypothetical protein [Prolixibacteraceae bacterium]